MKSIQSNIELYKSRKACKKNHTGGKTNKNTLPQKSEWKKWRMVPGIVSLKCRRA